MSYIGSAPSNPSVNNLGIWENVQTITVDFEISTNNNGFSAGPITIDSGVTITIPTGSVWVIL